MKTKNPQVEFQKELKEEARKIARELGARLEKGRHYLMQAGDKVNVEDVLEAFGFGRNGLE